MRWQWKLVCGTGTLDTKSPSLIMPTTFSLFLLKLEIYFAFGVSLAKLSVSGLVI